MDPLSQCSSSLYISQPSRIDGNPLQYDLHGVLWLLVKHWRPFMIQLHEAVKKHVHFEEVWVFSGCLLPHSFLLQASSALLPDSKQIHVVCFLPFVQRCQNIITAVLKWNKRIATLRITAQKQCPDGKKKKTLPIQSDMLLTCFQNSQCAPSTHKVRFGSLLFNLWTAQSSQKP